MKIHFNVLEAISLYPKPERLTGDLKKSRLIGVIFSVVFFIIITTVLLFVAPINKYEEIEHQVAPILLKAFIATILLYNCLGLAKGFFLKAYPFGKYAYNYGELPSEGNVIPTTAMLVIINTSAIQQILTLFIERDMAYSPLIIIVSLALNYFLLVLLTTFYLNHGSVK
ncbi:MAG: hypothetical protein Q4G11_05650 [Gallicola sp.]|nr:hypothetical protein [Gallicola sp.]